MLRDQLRTTSTVKEAPPQVSNSMLPSSSMTTPVGPSWSPRNQQEGPDKSLQSRKQKLSQPTLWAPPFTTLGKPFHPIVSVCELDPADSSPGCLMAVERTDVRQLAIPKGVVSARCLLKYDARWSLAVWPCMNQRIQPDPTGRPCSRSSQRKHSSHNCRRFECGQPGV
jgi:hypothetical protein